ANQLADHPPLRAIYNEAPALGHHREAPHAALLLFDLAGLLDDQADLHLERGAVVVVAIAAFFLTVLQPFQAVSAVVEDRRLLECAGQLDALATGVEGEVQLQVPREVLDGGNLIEDLTDSLAQEPLVGTPLHFNKIRHIQNLGNLLETTPRAPAAGHDLTRHRQPGAGRGRRGGANYLALGACLKGKQETGNGQPGQATDGFPFPVPCYRSLLDFDRGSFGLELGLDLLGFGLADLLLHRLGGTVNEVFGLLEPQPSELADHLDDLDL